ncbi:hypothetical protein BC629DRAFT_1438918 [Irpex lacteus]|nr:hypothetical protein BC629DRAFT_1438918 [Irpex lacteus]
MHMHMAANASATAGSRSDEQEVARLGDVVDLESTRSLSWASTTATASHGASEQHTARLLILISPDNIVTMQAMVTGADIPPELFRRILFDVCEDADSLLNTVDEEVIIHLNPGIQVLKRKEAIKNITACSLTCVYWASICRERLFEKVWIKHSEDMRAFSSLVASTPKRLQPIASHVFSVTLLQRVGDRPWVHLLHMQPSLFSLRRDVRVYFHIEDPFGYDLRAAIIIPQRSSHQRLFAAVPRTPPSSCLQCKGLTINNTHFATPHNLTSLLGSFVQWDSVELSHITWDAGARFESNSDLLIRDALEVFPSFITITPGSLSLPPSVAIRGNPSSLYLQTAVNSGARKVNQSYEFFHRLNVPVLYLNHYINIGYPILYKDVSSALSVGAMQYIMVYPWEHIAELCAAQEGFMRLQLEFDCHDRLLQFMEARRINLKKLDGRIALFYRAEGEFEVHAADFETLVDLGTNFGGQFLQSQ